MEEYLRDFKEMTYAATQEGNNFINEELDTAFYTQIANEVAKAIGVTEHTLFRRRHKAYL
jgi:hypothetical protein